MKNKEKYLDELLEVYYGKRSACHYVKELITKNKECKYPNCNECRNYVKKWLEEEYKKPIKLKQWEYDLLKYYGGKEFSNYGMLNYLKNKGNFKCITDTNMLITDILDNCEIVADDYSDFEECK